MSAYILIISLITTHWFGPDTVDFKSIEFNTEGRCEAVKEELNLEFKTRNIHSRAECVSKGE